VNTKKARARNGKGDSIPPALRVFAWNIGGRLTSAAKKQIALNVIERGRAWHWSKLPKGWFDLKFCLAHGQKRTQQTLRELFVEGR
jgi:hypothetical protein